MAREFRPGIIHVHSPAYNGLAALAVARRLRVPVVYEMRALWEDAAADRRGLGPRSVMLRLARAIETRVLRRAGLSKLSALQPAEPVQRYEHEAPGELLHLDTKKLGRIERPSHRVTGNRKDSVDGAGWETLFVAIDDHARIAYTSMHPDETKHQAVQFLRGAVSYFARLGVRIKRLLTDNGAAFRSRDFAQACQALGIKHSFTRAYRPQTNGKAERFIQSALREWAYGWTYQNSAQRTAALSSWQHHYNWHRSHSGIGGLAPMSRLTISGKNLLQVHT